MRMLCLAAVLLLVSLAPAAAQTPSPPPAPTAVDLAIDAVALEGPPPQRIDGSPTEPVYVQTVVRNKGPTPVAGYQLTYTWSGAGGQTPLKGPAKPASSVDVVEESLGSNATQTRRFQWPLQPEQSGAGRVVVRVEAISGNGAPPPADARPADNYRGVDVFVAQRSVQLAWASGPQQVHPEETVFLRLEVRNLGNIAEPVGLEVVPPTGAAQRLVADLQDALVAVPAGATRTTTLYVRFPDDGNTAPLSAQVSLRGTAPGRTLTATSPLISSTTQPLDLSRFHAALEPTFAPLVFASPDAPTVLEWTARNTGTASDTFLVEVDAEPGWTFHALPARLALEAGAQAPVRVEATPSGALPAGLLTPVTVALNSTHLALGGGASFRTEGTATLQVSGPAPELVAAAPESPHFYRGEESAFRVQVKNRGNHDLAGPSQVQLLLRMANNATRTATGSAPALAPGQSAWVVVPGGPLAVPGPVQFTFTWKVPGPLGEPVLAGQVAVHAPGITIIAPAPLQGRPGEAVTYGAPPHIFRVRNGGQDPERVDLEAQAAQGRAVLLGPAALFLDPGEERLVAVRHVLPQAAADGQDRLVLHATIGARETLHWSNEVSTALVDPAAPAITVRTRPAQWSLSAELPVEVVIEDDGPVASAVLWVTSPTGANRTVALTLRGSGTWGANLSFLVAGSHRIQVAATDAAGNRAVTLPWRVEAVAAPVPSFAAPAPPSGAWMPGDAVNVTVAFATSDRLSYLVRQDGVVVASGNASVVAGRAAIPLQGVRPGDVELELAMEGVSGPATSVLSLRVAEAPAGTSSSPPPLPRPTAKPTAAPGVAALLVAVAVALRRRP